MNEIFNNLKSGIVGECEPDYIAEYHRMKKHIDELNEKLIEKDILISVLVKEIRQLNEKTNG